MSMDRTELLKRLVSNGKKIFLKAPTDVSYLETEPLMCFFPPKSNSAPPDNSTHTCNDVVEVIPDQSLRIN